MTRPRQLDQAELARAITLCAQHSPLTVPLFEAAFHRAICLAAPGRQASLPEGLLARARLPTIVLVADDHGNGLDTGPAGWRAAGRMARWARHAVINAAGGRVEDYRAAVLLAVQVRKLVLVECGSLHFQAWHDLFAKADVSTVNLVARDGLHPVPGATGTVH